MASLSCTFGRVSLVSLSSCSSRGGGGFSSRATKFLQGKQIRVESGGIATRQEVLRNAAQSSNHEGLPIHRRHFLAGSALFLALPTARTGRASAEASAQVGSTESGSGKTVFVAGATGNTGKRVVRELLAKGFRVRAGVRNIEKAKQSLPTGENVEFVRADVTEGADKLSEAIKGVDAVIVATGFRPSITDPLASWKVDNLGTVALVNAAAKAGVKRFVMVSSLLVNGAATGQIFNPAYIVLNLFGLTLVAKLQAENYVRRSGINYTIIRPGGLKSDPPSGNILLSREDSLSGGSVSRDSVAELAVDSLLYPEASYKVVEIISEPDAPPKSVQDLLAAIPG